MKLLFVMRHSGYVRNFESTLRLLCERGHTVHLAFQTPETHWLLDPADLAQQLSDMHPRFTRGRAPMRNDTFGHAARARRLAIDYLRYLEPGYRDAGKLRERARREVPDAFVRQANSWPYRSPAGRRLLAARLRAGHRAVPTDPQIDAFLQVQQPDVLVVTPLIESGSPQAEYVRSARALGIRTAYCVASWDNLTNKGLIHGDVDLVTVWNAAMKYEAIELHGVAPERVVVTGAQAFDHWFEWTPSTSREQFAAQVGLPASEPYILYTCSSRFIAPDEVPFVRRWVEALRGAGLPRLDRVGVLIRPHPQNAHQWQHADVSGLGAVAIWPRMGASPADTRNRQDYFDSIFHSAAVVGVNTTAEIESAIVGRNVFAVLAEDFKDSQEGTVHFGHLRNQKDGLLHVASDLGEHARQLDQALGKPDPADDRRRRFVERFVRPHGVEKPATPRLVKALEALAALPSPAPEKHPWWGWVLQAHLAAHGARLQHAACVEVEERSARADRRAVRTKARAARRAREASKESALARAVMPPAEAAPAATAPCASVDAMATAYRALTDREKIRFGRSIADCRPVDVREAPRFERMDYPDAEIYLRVSSKSERKRLRACAKEPFTIDWLHQYVAAGDVLFDIGANVGAYSLVAALKPGAGARVVAFEPSYVNVAALCANIVFNRAQDQVTPLPIALSDRDGMAAFSLRALEAGSARHMLGDGPSPEGPTLYKQPVFTYRLDTLVDTLALPVPVHIKLDVDGGEMAVLAGATRTLAQPSLRSVLVEVGIELSDAVTGALERHGLTLTAKVPVTNKSGQNLVWYGLFTRNVPGDAANPVHLRPR